MAADVKTEKLFLVGKLFMLAPSRLTGCLFLDVAACVCFIKQ